jgi:hypothetical protein
MEQPPRIADLHPDPTSSRRMSLAARLLNVFAIPGQVFVELRTSPSAISNWLVPAILGAIIGLIWAVIVLSQPAVQQEFHDRQTKLIEERMKSGKMTAQEREIAETLTGPTVLKVAGGAGAVLGSFLNVLWWGFVLWLLGKKFLKVHVPFAKALEIAGLATMINVLGRIVMILLIVNFGKIGASPSLELAVKDFDLTQKGNLFAGAAIVFSFWVVGVRSIGLAKLAGVPYLRAAWAVVIFWVLEQSFFIITGLGQLVM